MRQGKYQCLLLSRLATSLFKRFVTCAKMLMHAIAHRGCMDTVRESALEFDSRRKTPGPQTHTCTAPGFSIRCSTNWALRAPVVCQIALSVLRLPVMVTYLMNSGRRWQTKPQGFLSVSFTAHWKEKRSWKLTECMPGCTIIVAPQEQFLLEFYWIWLSFVSHDLNYWDTFFVVRSNDSFNFPLGWIKYSVIVINWGPFDT